MENKDRKETPQKTEQHQHADEHEHDVDGDQGHEEVDEHLGEEDKHDDDDKHHDEHGEHGEHGEEGQEGDESQPAEIQQTNEQDARSVYVKNVDYSSTKEEVGDFFKSCGKITRVTIITDKYTGNPKGYAYIEFADKEGAENAIYLSDSTFKGRTISVTPKRTNVPFRGRGRGRRPSRGGFYPIRRGFQMFAMRPMRRGFRPY